MTSSIESGCSSASDTFEVTREALLEPGTAVQPSSIVRTPDGGYVITGTVARKMGLAIKTDAQGKVVWRYSLASEADSARDDIQAPNFTGAVEMADRSTFLCGDFQKKVKAVGAYGPFQGVLVKLDADGRLQIRKNIVPAGDQSYSLNQIYNCTRWNDGVLVLGFTGGSRSEPKTHPGYWVIYLDATGSIAWEKQIPYSLTNVHGFSRPRLLANGDLLFSAWQSGGKHATEFVQIDSAGVVKNQYTVEGVYWLVRTAEQSDPVRLVSVFKGAGTKSIVTLDSALNVRDTQIGPLANDLTSLAYEMRDGSVVVFGAHNDSGGDANIVKWGPDFQKEIREFRFEKWLQRERGSRYDPSVADAVPTGSSNEFAMIRLIIVYGPSGSVGPESGIQLSFVRVK